MSDSDDAILRLASSVGMTRCLGKPLPEQHRHLGVQEGAHFFTQPMTAKDSEVERSPSTAVLFEASFFGEALGNAARLLGLWKPFH
jgi:hypothetical protein